MSRLLHRVFLTLMAFFAAMAVAQAQGADPEPAAPRQVLVMLRLPPDHFRPNTDYGGGYGDAAGRAVRLRQAGQLARKHGVTVVNDWPMPLLGVDCYVMEVPASVSPDELAAELAQEPTVLWTTPVHSYQAQGAATPAGDPLYRVQPAASAWNLTALHRISTGRNVRVAVIDSMVERAHPDLVGQVDLLENFVPTRAAAAEQHGTGVAGVIAARADNGVGIAGVAPKARLMALRACWQEPMRPGVAVITTNCDSLSLAKALHFAIDHNAQVINLSLSGPEDLLLSKLIDVALSRGATVVAAYDRTTRGGGFPASHPGVLAVSDELGPSPRGAVSAPGRDVPTTQPGGRWYFVNGSSYAAAHVSGLVALVRERTGRPPSTGSLVLARATDTIDACATLLQTSEPCNCSCSRPQEVLTAYSK